MPLEKLSFNEAKRRANERIAEWVSETKAAGIVRLQDRYGAVFKKIDWRAGHSQAPKKGTKLKPMPEQAKNETDNKMTEVGQFTHDIPPSRMGRHSPNQSRCKSRERSRQTPERCQSSRLTSEKRSDSRKRYRDSASLIYGDNRNNRSSLMASVCSDAMSLIQDGVASEWQDLYQETKINTKINERTRAEMKFLNLKTPTIDYRANKRQSYLPVRKSTNGPTFPAKRTLQKDSKLLNIFPANFRKRKRTIRNWEKEVPYFKIDAGVLSSGTSSGTSVIIGTETIQNPSVGVTTSPPKGPTVGLKPLPCIVTKNCNHSVTRVSSRRFDMSKSGLALAVTTGLSRAKSSCFSRRQLVLSRSAHKRSTNSSDSSKQFTPERGTPKGKVALRRFRILVRMIMSVMLILRTTVKTVQQNMRSDVKRKKKKTGVLMAFDPSYYSSATTTYGHLSERSRNALQKVPRIRTEADIRVLTEVMCRLPLFAKYSRKVKEELARFVWYDMHETGRIIIRQGDMGSRMYFVVSGTVSIHRTEVDPKTGIKVIQHLRDIEMGSTFGELALIRNISRTYSAACKVDSEFLSVDKDQFNKVLRQNWEESWQNRYNFLMSSPYFKAWTKEQLRQTADVALTKEYNNNSVIFGNERKVTNWVYFILKGRCRVVQKLSLVRSKSPYRRSCLTLPGTQKAEETLNTFMNKPYGKRQRQLALDTHFLTITTLQKGDYFGVGEDMSDCYIVTTEKAEILLLNAASFSIHSKREELECLKDRRNGLLPSFKQLHRQFEINRRWWEYKRGIVSEVVQRRSIPNNTSIADIPRSIRESEGISQCLAEDITS
ncbi:uncharacterized protein LOC110457241 isoform X2 [Mizuhopecten yessoensis]|uniref:Cyclic nucleotide-binding domain-containing protein 2 n=1 Tax=Mizuhopecten yessoensis TaxID=6573 RepID=A0A210Q998_MIZYE|nr:uncharacterized protein LOC110457241 isoform X2 [Mizuhopecten yessoensis]OWF45308.1 Cyclic nucleotide-binding domain-containing protein 2 [Mizuhopecten yessoensis]